MPETKAEYIVKSGDCLWNIARENLKSEGQIEPSDREVAIETDRLALLNHLDENGRKRDLIYPGERLLLRQ